MCVNCVEEAVKFSFEVPCHVNGDWFFVELTKNQVKGVNIVKHVYK